MKKPPEPGGLPDEPTEARPATPEKIAVMRYRALCGRSCFHPDDPHIEWECTVPRSQTVSLENLFAAVLDDFHKDDSGDFPDE